MLQILRKRKDKSLGRALTKTKTGWCVSGIKFVINFFYLQLACILLSSYIWMENLLLVYVKQNSCAFDEMLMNLVLILRVES